MGPAWRHKARISSERWEPAGGRVWATPLRLSTKGCKHTRENCSSTWRADDGSQGGLLICKRHEAVYPCRHFAGRVPYFTLQHPKMLNLSFCFAKLSIKKLTNNRGFSYLTFFQTTKELHVVCQERWNCVGDMPVMCLKYFPKALWLGKLRS